jgi:competence protein ComEA
LRPEAGATILYVLEDHAKASVVLQGGENRMPRATRLPLWGWTASVRIWLTVAGVLAAVGLVAGNATLTRIGPVTVAPRLVVDPNTASPEVLCTLPKMGPATVARIVAAREMSPFRSLEDFDARVRGVGPATMASLRQHLQIEPSVSEPIAASTATPTEVVAVPAARPVRIARSP